MALTAMSASRADRSVGSAGPRRAVRIWLWLLVAMVVVMVGLGGATRLTGSGLSITEWRPVTGTVPPLSDADWHAEFEKYRDTPQYRILNQGLGLSDFKPLYWWEWGHRLFGRLIGLVFFLPLAFFWWRGALDRRLGLGLVALGLLGGLQGAVGWIMVASGLQPGMIAVAPLKLALHLTIASLILAGLVWLASGSGARKHPVPLGVRASAYATLALILLQIGLGGLVAGSKAGLLHNTWPTMDGVFVPPAEVLFATSPWIENFVDNLTLVQFNHRMIAYLTLLVAMLHAVLAVARGPLALARGAALVAILVLAQAVLGIVTLLLQVPFWAGLSHQVFAMFVLVAATAHARSMRRVDAPVAAEPVPVTPFGFERLERQAA